MSASLQSPPHSQIAHISRPKDTSANSSVAPKNQMLQVENRQHQPQQQQQQPLLEVDQSCMNFMEQTQYATVNLQPVVSTGFATPAAPIIPALPPHEVIKQFIVYYKSLSSDKRLYVKNMEKVFRLWKVQIATIRAASNRFSLESKICSQNVFRWAPEYPVIDIMVNMGK